MADLSHEHQLQLQAMGWRPGRSRRRGEPPAWYRPAWGLRIEPGSLWVGTIQADPESVPMDDDPVRLARHLVEVVTTYQPQIERVAEVGDLLVTVEPTLTAGSLVQVGVIIRAARRGLGLRCRLPSGDVRQAPADCGQVERWLIVAEVIDVEAAMAAAPRDGAHSLDRMREYLRPYLRPGVQQFAAIEQRQKRRKAVPHG